MPIDRQAVVHRHNVVLRAPDPMSPLSVGNGDFCFTADITGLQSFPAFYKSGIPLCTMSSWGWHSNPAPVDLPNLRHRLYKSDNATREVPYASDATDQEAVWNHMRQNPHRMHLGFLGFDLGEDITALTETTQELDLWTGTIHSRFTHKGKRTEVRTIADPMIETVAVQVKNSPAIRIRFPFPSHTPEAVNDRAPAESHVTTVVKHTDRYLTLQRRIDDDRYFAHFRFTGATCRQVSPHEWLLTPEGDTLTLVATFEDHSHPPTDTITFDAVADAATKHWHSFWTTGGAIDISQSTDPRWKELERRMVLSQYLTAINCSGTAPPAETGLTCNSWYGKFHLEMHWWHAAHFPLWSRTDLLQHSMAWYRDILPGAQAIARAQGYLGARWPKMTDNSGVDSPSPIAPLLIWQQPHPIYYAELLYRDHKDETTLNAYWPLVRETALFMASYATWDEEHKRYNLGPPLIPAQERHSAATTMNPTYELEYWHWALGIYAEWRKRLGLAPDERADHVRNNLAKLPVADGPNGSFYLAAETAPDTFEKINIDHPSMLCALGFLPGALVDKDTMSRTLDRVIKEWTWPDTWGWDYPVCALTAARLGRYEDAIDLLLKDTPKNKYHANGHNYQRPGLHLYLPGNGGLLAAIAHMAATNAFPKSFNVEYENLHPLL